MTTMTIFTRTLLAGLSLACALPAHAEGAHWGQKLPETATSHIFAPIALPGSADDEALKKADYVQEEYLLSGTGNIYAEGLKAARSAWQRAACPTPPAW
jgi:hypothetical protein